MNIGDEIKELLDDLPKMALKEILFFTQRIHEDMSLSKAEKKQKNLEFLQYAERNAIRVDKLEIPDREERNAR